MKLTIQQLLLSIFALFFSVLSPAQHITWPHELGRAERQYVERNGFEPLQSRGIETPPPFDSLRTAAEWEEVEALTISWTSFPCIQKQIVAAAK